MKKITLIFLLLILSVSIGCMLSYKPDDLYKRKVAYVESFVYKLNSMEENKGLNINSGRLKISKLLRPEYDLFYLLKYINRFGFYYCENQLKYDPVKIETTDTILDVQSKLNELKAICPSLLSQQKAPKQ